MSDNKLNVIDLHKRYGEHEVLKGVSLQAKAGDVISIIGSSGSGKSTFLRCINFLEKPSEGTIVVSGQNIGLVRDKDGQLKVADKNQLRLLRTRLTMVFQHFNLWSHMTVLENVMEAPIQVLGLSKQEARERAVKYLAKVGIDERQQAKYPVHLSGGQQQRLCIARALAVQPDVLLMDEPTSALSQSEVKVLFKVIAQLKRRGVTIIYISHRLEELMEIGDNITIFRDGRFISERHVSDASVPWIIEQMVGDKKKHFDYQPAPKGDAVLDVKGLTALHPSGGYKLNDVTFTLSKGEVIGIYGLLGAGRTELMQALSGVSRPSSGEIRLNGRTMRFHQPADAIRAGIVCVPEERQKQGAIIALPIAQNISLPQLSKLNPNGVLNDAREWRLADEYASRLQVKAFSWRQPVETLSGGNQQKVVIGKWLATQPEVIILDEPTKGIDIGSKAAVHQFMSELVSQGLAVIMVSSELPEVMGMADRIIVMHEGLMVAEYRAGEATAETIVSAASGIGQEAA